MLFRADEIILPAEDIYKNDVLNRKPTIDFIENFLTSVQGPFVLGIDAPWGSGKTTAIRLLKATMEIKGATCVYFNAWKVDYSSDPLVALIAALDSVSLKSNGGGKQTKAVMKSVRTLLSSFMRHGAVAAIKAGTLGALDLDAAMERVAADLGGELTTDVIDSFHKERESLDRLREALEVAITDICAADGSKQLYFFIDELDRCRPSFAIEVLERIKHLFDLKKLVFILAVDKTQLGASIEAVYGSRFNSQEYLRRFFDLEFILPTPDLKGFLRHQIEKFQLAQYFTERSAKSNLRDEVEDLVSTMSELSRLFGLSLRSAERAIGRVALICSQTPSGHYFEPILVAFLVVLRVTRKLDYDTLASGNWGADEVADMLRGLPGGSEFCDSHTGLIIRAYLLIGDTNETRKHARLQKIRAIAESSEHSPERAQAMQFNEVLQYTPPGTHRHQRFKISSVTNKIDLAATLAN